MIYEIIVVVPATVSILGSDARISKSLLAPCDSELLTAVYTWDITMVLVWAGVDVEWRGSVSARKAGWGRYSLW